MTTADWLVSPLLIPAVVAPITLLFPRQHIFLARFFSILAMLAGLSVSVLLFWFSSGGEVLTYSMGNWASPFGIVLVLDHLSALMLVLTFLVGLAVLLYSVKGWDLRGPHFHALFLFQIMGINGAFLTGDLFNLFVFFEVLLIASYGLMVHGGGGTRVRAGVQYVIINLIGSSFFLIAAGLIYSVVGTLNMADLAIKVSQVKADDMAIINTGAILLFLVFFIKSAMIPFHFWLPGTYANAPAPVAALFALLTKVGAYCIVRVSVLAFPDLISVWLLPLALLSLVLGSLGVLAATSLGQMVSFYMIGSMGTLLAVISLFDGPSLSAGIYYLLHSTFMGVILFLIVDLVRWSRPTISDSLKSGPPFAHMGLLSGAFFVAAIGAVGMPPLSGFIGKLFILQSSWNSDWAVWIWVTLLSTSLLTLIGFARAGSGLFWKSHSDLYKTDTQNLNQFSMPWVPLTLVFSAVLVLTVFANPISHYTEKVAQQLMDSQNYIKAVIKDPVVKR
jgi:multicomponent K+:H+ antiporter subunit D